MNLFNLVDFVQRDTLDSLRLFKPELALCATIVLMLLLRVLPGGRVFSTFLVALAGSAIGLWFSVEPLTTAASIERTEIFTGMLVYDSLTIFFRALLLFFAVLFTIFTWLSGIPDREDAPDFYTLVLGATLGMCLMASSNHLLMVFLSVEIASVPSYALAGMLKGRRKSSEAALKYSVFGAGTAGVMLYGISLLAGVLGSCHFPTMAGELARMISEPALADRQMVLVLGGLMVMVGLAFKLSAVPFHFWCPDVFEGASAEVNAFLSVSSKAAALALLVRVAFGLGYVPSDTLRPAANEPLANVTPIVDVIESGPPTPAADANAEVAAESAFAGGVSSIGWTAEYREQISALQPVRDFATMLVAMLAAITCTFGNLAAYGQTNIKRLLAYSTIAHAGYMLMPVAAALALAGDYPRAAENAIGALAFYAAVYLFMNLGAFAIVAFLRNEIRSEEIADYAGLVRFCPGLVVCLSMILFSLVGLPPLSGFAGKWAIFASLFSAIRLEAAPAVMWTLLIVGGVNTALSLFYYLNVIKVMTMDPVPEHRLPAHFAMVSVRGAYVFLITLPVLLLGIWWGDLYDWAQACAQYLLS